MPREVIHIQVGQCGNQVGCKFWETIAQEHGLNNDGEYAGGNPVQLEKIDVFYHETDGDNYVPRAVLVDMEYSVLNHIQSRNCGGMFRPENIVGSQDGAADIFMNGFYSEDATNLSGRVLERLRSETERTDCCQGFTFSHSSGGGTGSGLTMKIAELGQELLVPSFGGTYFFTVFPSRKVSNTVLEPFNSMLVLEKQTLAENVVCFDNESLYKICFNTLGLSSPTFGDMNRLVSMVMAGNTAAFRFPGQVNTDMNKLSYSLRCRPFLHYYVPSFAPLSSLKTQRYRKVTVAELVRQMSAEENSMFETTPEQSDLDSVENPEKDDDNPDAASPILGKCFAYAAMFRGNMSSQDVDEALAFLKGDQTLENNLRETLSYEQRKNYVLESVKTCQLYQKQNPRPTFNTITNFAAPGMPMSCTYLRNTSQVKFKFLKILREAMRMFATGSFVSWYDPERQGKTADSMTTLEEALNKMSQEWISEFGTEDGSSWPEPIDESLITAGMIA